MTKKELENKLKTINENELLNCTTAADYKKIFTKCGLEVTDSELNAIVEKVNESKAEMKNKELSTELSEDSLENVNGGSAMVVMAVFSIIGMLASTTGSIVTAVSQSNAQDEQEEQTKKNNASQRTSNSSTTGGTNGSANLL